MPKTQFEVSILSCPEEGFTENGTDKVEFCSPQYGRAVKTFIKNCIRRRNVPGYANKDYFGRY